MVKRVSRRLSVTGRVFITLTGASSLGAVGPSTSKGPAAVPVLPPAVSFSAPRGRLRFYPGFSCQRVTCHVPGGPLPSAMLRVQGSGPQTLRCCRPPSNAAPRPGTSPQALRLAHGFRKRPSVTRPRLSPSRVLSLCRAHVFLPPRPPTRKGF